MLLSAATVEWELCVVPMTVIGVLTQLSLKEGCALIAATFRAAV